MGKQRWIMDPDARLDYSWDFTSSFGEYDPVVSATVTIDPTGALAASNVTVTGPLVSCILSGGVAGQRYAVTVHAESMSGLEDDVTDHVLVIEQ